MSLALPFSTLAQIELSRLYARGESSPVLLSYLPSLALGITGILLLGREFGVLGMSWGFLLSQAVLALSLYLPPQAGGVRTEGWRPPPSPWAPSPPSS
jgi:O-antigen/teichoic acid export membrane protein